MKIYLVCTQATCFSDLDHEVLKAFSTFDKAERYLLKKQDVQTDHSYEYLIETIVVDTE